MLPTVRKIILLSGSQFVLAMATAIGAPVITSNFDFSIDSWTSDRDQTLQIQVGGVPSSGGYLQITNQSNGTIVMSAPSKFLGLLSTYDTGIIYFDAIIKSGFGIGPVSNFGLLTISSVSNINAHRDLGTESHDLTWQRFSTPLSASNFIDNSTGTIITQTRWSSLLTNVRAVTIDLSVQGSVQNQNGQNQNGQNEIVGLDNFTVATPEPSYTVVMLLLCSVGSFSLRKAKCRSRPWSLASRNTESID